MDRVQKLQRTRFLYPWCPPVRSAQQPNYKCRRSMKWACYRIRAAELFSSMPERFSLWCEQLENLVRFHVPGERAVASPPAPAGSRGSRRKRSPRSGGVLPPRDSKASWAVNIRPKNWGDKDKIWWGKIKSMREAQRISDIVHHYLGCESVHFLFPGSDRPPPPFANPNLGGLHSLEKRMQYVKFIAKGEQFQALRREFMESVKEMVRLLMKEDGADAAAAATGTAAAAAVGEVPWSWTESQPELGGDECRLSPEIPCLIEEDIEYMMMMVLDDAVS